MKTIKIFLASSEELENDRNAFGNLIRKLNKTYEKRGISLDLFSWEDYDAAYNDRRKQDEYNDAVRASDMFLAVFHRVAGKFTIEEFDVATEEFRKKASPKVYAYCKDLKAGDVESEELKKFKGRLFNEMGHYWSRYGNRDTMQFHFVMQLQLVESSGSDTLKVENRNVVLDGQHIARMENLPFAGLNEDFQRMNRRLMELPDEIALQEYRRSCEITEQKRQNVITSIDELLLKASTTIADLSISIENRIAKVEELYGLYLPYCTTHGWMVPTQQKPSTPCGAMLTYLWDRCRGARRRGTTPQIGPP